MTRRLFLVAAPPFGARLFDVAVERMRQVAPTLEVVVRSAGELGAGWQQAGDALAAQVGAGDALVGHGFAVPAVLRAAERSPAGPVILVNGPLVPDGPVVSAVRRAGRVPGSGRLVPGALWYAGLRSSLGLRRAVNNPYVMDRDTVAAVCDLAHSGGSVAAAAAWFGSLVGPWPEPAGLGARLTLLWGDNDRLFPLSGVDRVATSMATSPVVVAPGGRWMWPLEMPWAFADAVLARVGGPTTTSTSQRGGSGPGGGGGFSLSSEEEAGLAG